MFFLFQNFKDVIPWLTLTSLKHTVLNFSEYQPRYYQLPRTETVRYRCL